MTTALMTDRYELTMGDTALAAGRAETSCVFQVFARRLPAGRTYGVVAGVGPMLDALTEFRFDDATLDWLTSTGVVSQALADRLDDRAFSGRIHAMRDGELWFPNMPVARIEGPFAEAVLLETIVLSVLNHGCAVATAASLMRRAAGTRTLFDMGGRRVDPHAAIAGAYAAFVGGFDLTSNLAAGRRWGIPTAGTAAHASVLLAPSERAAFDAQIASLGTTTTLLVDTYDIADGIRNAVAAARAVGVDGPGAIRIDSGDPLIEVPRARALLDRLGATTTTIVLSGDLDEHAISELSSLPVSMYGVGTSLATGSGHPTAGLVYKLVEVDGRPVAKQSIGKSSEGGATTVDRLLDADGDAISDQVRSTETDAPVGPHRPLLHLVWDGKALDVPNAAAARSHHLAVLAEGANLITSEPA